MAKRLEDLVEEAGGCGRYQFLLVPLVFLNLILSPFSQLMMIFGAVEPDWWCKSRDLAPNASLSNVSDTLDLEYSYLNVSMDVAPSDDRNSYTNAGSVSMTNTSMAEGLKSCKSLPNSQEKCQEMVFIPGVRTVVSEFHLVCDKSWIPSMIISLQMVGFFIGTSVSGQLGDSIGRKKTLMTMGIFHCVFAFIGAFSISWQMFAVVRMMLGFALGGIHTVTFVYLPEFVGVRHRGTIAAFPYWGMGTTSLSLTVWVLRDWRRVQLATSLLVAATLPAWLFLPESMRWLSVKGHVDKAQMVLNKMAAWNHRKSPDVTPVGEISCQPQTTKQNFTYFDIFSTWRTAKVSVLSGISFFACSLAYYGISFGIKSLTGDFYLNFLIMALLEIPPPLLTPLLFRWLGRRWTCCVVSSIISLCCLAFIPVHLFVSTESAGTIMNGLAMTARMCLYFYFNAVTFYAVELYPTVVRNIGLGFCQSMATVGSILSPIILSAVEGKIFIFYAIIGCGMAVAAISALLLRETRGQPLEDELVVSKPLVTSNGIIADTKFLAEKTHTDVDNAGCNKDGCNCDNL